LSSKNTTETPGAVSIVVRCKNEAATIDQTLTMLRLQDYNGEIEHIIIDSGSTDGSLQIIRQHCPNILNRIDPQDYIPGKVLNNAMKIATYDWVVFLNADATPANEQWLTNILTSKSSCDNFGAAFCRQIPREKCIPTFAIDYEKCFAKNRQSKKWDHFFSMVGSLVHRPVWKKLPFDEVIQYSEDEEWTRRLKNNGLEIVYAEDSVVIHSHNYTLKECCERACGEMIANVQMRTLKPNTISFFYGVIIKSILAFTADIPYHIKHRDFFDLPYGYAIRFAQKYGQWLGNRTADSSLDND